ncbi:hypothetical protein [Acinetobacter chengduensis]|uniref:Carboxypeptidase regulatory-like domain-containing protein n=1 Tax=Acinetobacter chengduensis TaxID=2420890 RepID=A0ABX9TSD8_9GAMM|nr:hypothetical protein [Acinetobacter chengduensis]RLL16980.1 hypothetical protein D9K81_17660 [Acinetobacter chengduensis]
MKPTGFVVKKNGVMLQDLNGLIYSSIKGSINKQGEKYIDAMVILYNRSNLLPIAVSKPDIKGRYQFLNLYADLKTFIVAFDQKQQYNAVIQDNVVPK